MRKLLLGLAAIFLWAGAAQAQTPFYQGKTVTIIVGYLAGDGYAMSRQRRGDTTVFTHTEIQPEFEGKGLGSVLARAALDGARDTGLTVVPECLFIRGYIESHPEYTELLESR